MLKISYIMQSYLGSYETQCSSPKAKLLRAVNSVLNQKHENVELVLVSDGCPVTKKIYEIHFKNNPKVKFAYVDKDLNLTLSVKPGERFYRGVPREVGRAIATGNIITYLDTDDYALPTHALTLVRDWTSALSQNKDYLFCINAAWWDHASIQHQTGVFKHLHPGSKPTKIEGLESEWIVSHMLGGKFSLNTNLLSHRANLPQSVKWKDETTINEDAAFYARFKATDPYGERTFQIKQPMYVRCHAWDAIAGKPYWDF